jgi:3-oxoacyl-(acyl-carrier-protein) synthase
VKRRVVVTGVGAVTGAFSGGAAALDAFLARPAGVPANAPARIADSVLSGLVDETEARRLSRICQYAVAAARLALVDAGLAGPDGPGDVGLVLGTEHGDFHSTIAFADGYLHGGATGLSALLFPSTVMNTMAAATTIAVAAREGSLTLNAPGVAGHLAVAHAAAAVAAGRLPVALAGGVDAHVDLVQEALIFFGMTEPRGEGAAFLVLEPLPVARSRGATVHGEVLGTAWRALPARPQGVGRSTASRAVARAAAQAGLGVERLAWVYGSASGDGARDAWERAVLREAFGGRRVPEVALASRLGQHAGLGPLSVAAAARTARTGRTPGSDNGGGAAGAPGLVHALARGGTHVALVIGPPPAADGP